MPVAAAKIAVDSARRRRRGSAAPSSARVLTRARIGEGPEARTTATIPPGPGGLFLGMPNIKQQKRRVDIAARQRLETAAAEGDADEVARAHREFVSCIDKAAATRAVHPNRAARKKAQAARLAAGS